MLSRFGGVALLGVILSISVFVCQLPLPSDATTVPALESNSIGGANQLPPSSYYSLKERFRNAVFLPDETPHDRQKRLAVFLVRFPHGTGLEVKWSVNLPMEAEKKYKGKFQIGFPIKIGLPTYMVDDAYDPPFGTLFGQVFEAARKKRSLHVRDRIDAYETVQGFINNTGMPPKDCLLRTICEVAEAPLEFGIIGDLLNMLLTPSAASVSADSEDLQQLEEHLKAEELGRLQGNCEQLYQSCHTSVFDMLPIVKHSVL